MEKEWMNALPEDERRVYDHAGFSQSAAIGHRPVLLVIDCTFGFTGSRPQSLDEAILEYPMSCGEYAWAAFPNIRHLLDRFRENRHPIVYTVMDLKSRPFLGSATKAANPPPDGFNRFPDLIGPRDGEWVLEKTKASAFFDTPLASYLLKVKADSLVICGGTTSGCVRASAVDGFSYGYSCFVVEDGCFDRSATAHRNNLFDMNAKYAAVRSADEILMPSRVQDQGINASPGDAIKPFFK